MTHDRCRTRPVVEALETRRLLASVPDGFTDSEDTWYAARVCGTFKERAGWHGCQMPEQVLGRILRSCSNPGDVVLDPFAGSGTTLAVAKKLDRRFLGFELSPEYAANVERRLSGITPGDPLEGSETPHVRPARRLVPPDEARPARRRVARAGGLSRGD